MEKYSTNRMLDTQRARTGTSMIDRDSVSHRRMMAIRVDAMTDEFQTDDKPVWRGDHSFSADAAKYSLLNFIEPDVAEEHPEWSRTEVRKAALERFEQRLAQDFSYEQKESDHVETAVHWHIVETEPGHKELATTYGGETVTLSKLWEHTRQYAAFVGNPDAYNAEEEKAQRVMEQAFIAGDSHTYISVLSHPDSIRYVQLWEQGNDGDVVSKQIDLQKTTGRDFSRSEGEKLIAHLAAFQEQTRGIEVVHGDAHYAHFMLDSAGQVIEQDVRMMAVMQVAQIDAPQKEVTLVQSVDSIMDKGEQILWDTHAAFKDLTRYVEDEVQKKIQILQESHHESSVVIRKKRPVAKQIEVHIPEKSVLDPSLKKSESTGYNKTVVEHDTDRKHKYVKTSEQPLIVLVPSEGNPIKSILSEWIITKTILTFVAEQPSGAGAALYWMRVVTTETPHTEPISPSQLKEVIPKGVRVYGAMDTLRSYVAKGASVLRDTFNKQFGSPRLTKERVDAKPKIKKIDVVVRPHTTKSEPMPRVPRMKKEIQHIYKRTIELFRRILQRSVKKQPEITTPILPNQGRQQHAIVEQVTLVSKEAKNVPDLAIFALVYWHVLNKRRTLVHKSVDVALLLRGVESVLVRREPMVSEQKKSVQMEDGETGSEHIWMLLSIIWYLAMLRESQGGGAWTQQSGSTVQPIAPQLLTPMSLPTSGIIYLFTHDNQSNTTVTFMIE